MSCLGEAGGQIERAGSTNHVYSMIMRALAAVWKSDRKRCPAILLKRSHSHASNSKMPMVRRIFGALSSR
jgi:hypothetical protein